MVSEPDEPRAGAELARKRWGPPRILRLDELSPEKRRIILALVELGEPDQAKAADDAAA